MLSSGSKVSQRRLRNYLRRKPQLSRLTLRKVTYPVERQALVRCVLLDILFGNIDMLEEEVIGQRRFSDRVCISDPCYERGTWCGEYDLDIKEGSYECRTIVGEWHDWGERVWRLTTTHEHETVTKWEFETNLGVDAAMMSIICSKHYDYERKEALSDYRVNAGQTGHGFYSNTGLGDGTYALFCGHNDKDEIVALSVIFLYPDGVEESVADEDGIYSFSNEETVKILSKYAHCSVEQYTPTKQA